MKKRVPAILAFLILTVSLTEAAGLRVVGAYPYIRDIAARIGGDDVEVTSLARGDFNPHVIVPRPSFIAQIRRADLLIINGAQLEIGWIPPLLRQANNGAVQPGEPGFLDLSRHVTLIDVPASVSREHGDVHPEGNPHFALDPDNVPLIARAIRDKFIQLDPPNSGRYTERCRSFSGEWEKRTALWNEKMKPLGGVRVVEYHKSFDYFLRRYSLVIAGTVEPLPGIPPTSKHIERLEAALTASPAKFILQDVYNPDDASRHLSERLGMKLVVIPQDVDAVREAGDIFSLFDDIVGRLTR